MADTTDAIPGVNLAEAQRVARLTPPDADVRMVLDTDTYNEIDDQFALVYALLAPSLDVEAIYAAPFHNDRSEGPGDGMAKSHEEIRRLLDLLKRTPADDFVHKGATRYLADADGPVDNPASADLIERARAADPSEPLYVVAIGAPTNVAAALLQAPDIGERIVVVWLGGQPLGWPRAAEFNLGQDPLASRALFDSGVPLVQIPALNVSQHVCTSLPELEAELVGRGDLAAYLLSIFAEYGEDAGRTTPWTKEIWDLAAIGYLVDPDWVPTSLRHSPILTDQLTYSHDPQRHLIRVASTARRDPIFADFFSVLESPGP